jgi:hypothetical protein
MVRRRKMLKRKERVRLRGAQRSRKRQTEPSRRGATRVRQRGGAAQRECVTLPGRSCVTPHRHSLAEGLPKCCIPGLAPSSSCLTDCLEVVVETESLKLFLSQAYRQEPDSRIWGRETDARERPERNDIYAAFLKLEESEKSALRSERIIMPQCPPPDSWQGWGGWHGSGRTPPPLVSGQSRDPPLRRGSAGDPVGSVDRDRLLSCRILRAHDRSRVLWQRRVLTQRHSTMGVIGTPYLCQGARG